MYSQCFSSVYFFGSGSNFNLFIYFFALFCTKWSTRCGSSENSPCFLCLPEKSYWIGWFSSGVHDPVCWPQRRPSTSSAVNLNLFFFFLRLLYELRKTHIVIAGLQLLCSCALTGNSLVCSFVYLRHSNTCAGLAWGREPALCYSQENVTVHLHMDGKGRKVQGCSFAASPDCPLTTLTRPLETFCQNLCTKSA